MTIQIQIYNTSQNSKKRLRALFKLHKGGPIIKITDFGLKGGSTYIDHKDKTKRRNYIARHSVNEKKFYTDPQRPATLSRYILWGPYADLDKNINYYKKKFKLS